MRFVVGMLLVCAWAPLTFAGDITYNIEGTPVVRNVNVQQTNRMIRLKDRNNTATGETLTTNQWVRDAVDACMKGQDDQLSVVEAPDACTTFYSHTPAEQATALATYYGGKNPCVK
jgi:hypothetical protein